MRTFLFSRIWTLVGHSNPTPSKIQMSRSRRWRSTQSSEKRKEERAASRKYKLVEMHGKPPAADQEDYSTWSQEKLIQRVTQLESELKSKNLSVEGTPPPENTKKVKKLKPRTERAFDPSKYNTRLVAFKLAYLGKNYNGFEHHEHKTPKTTIEEELWIALNKARLIFPKNTPNPLKPGEVNWEGCDYSKCGRTDKGVSSFGQVIGIRVRSSRPLAKKIESSQGREADASQDRCVNGPGRDSIELASPPLDPANPGNRANILPNDEPEIPFGISDPENLETLSFDPILDEIPYCSLLNRILPPDIKILAWCPAPPLDFSARFSCRERQYKYFFTQPAFPPTPHQLEIPSRGEQMKDGWLNIEAMREAAKYFEGEHDFRNFCKVDPGKQISHFDRTIFFADIEEVNDTTNALSYVSGRDFAPTGSTIQGGPKVYTFTLHGSAFLWHQVRCMVAVLFLVAQGLERPTVVKELLDAKTNPRRPTYEMADETPLVLWNCVFPLESDPERKEALQWHYVGDGLGQGVDKYGNCALMDDLWKVWRGRKIDEMLASSLINIVSKSGEAAGALVPREKKGSRSQKIFDGGDWPRLQGLYTPVMQKPLMDSVEVVNERYAIRKGFESAADLKTQGYKRLNRPDLHPEAPAYFADRHRK